MKMTTKVEEGRSMKVKLSSVRIAKGYTTEEAAKICGVTKEEMGKLEDEPESMSASMVLKLREVYGIPIDYVI